MNPSSSENRWSEQTIRTRVAHAFVAVAVGSVLLVGLDVAVGLYDVATDSTTKAGGINAAPRPLKAGVNSFVWGEPYRASGVEFALAAKNVSQAELDALQRGVTGNLHVGRVAGVGEMTTRWEYSFVLALQPATRLPTVERFDGPGGKAGPDTVAMGVRYEVMCFVQPTEDSRSAAMAFHSAEFDAGEQHEFAIILDGAVPASMQLLMSYSRRPRSFLEGTVLGRVSAWLAPR